jgi:hypothetical protein
MMKQFRLDYTQQQTMQMSNDAFFYLLQEEEPLDEDNLEEALEVFAMFPHGFYIEENWKAVEDSDLIECTLVPYVEDDMDFDEYSFLTKSVQQQIKWLDANTVRVWWYNLQTGIRKLRGDFKVYTNSFGHKCFHTGDQNKEFIAGEMSLYFLKHFKKKNM